MHTELSFVFMSNKICIMKIYIKVYIQKRIIFSAYVNKAFLLDKNLTEYSLFLFQFNFQNLKYLC